ncbi:MAG: hypothetical protein IKN18_00960, partial [Neisseriaceae bacterium]|nr:hypothetical protein [Neisseriaceae bacterium]
MLKKHTLNSAYSWLKKNALFFVLSVVILSITRYILWHFYTDNIIRTQFSADVSALFSKGLLFDIKASAIATAIPFLLSCLLLTTRKTQALGERFLPFLWTILLTIVLILTVCYLYFFRIYGHQFDAFVFGIIDEDTKAVVKTIWSDFPVMRLIFAWLIASFLFWQIFHQRTKNTLLRKKTLTVFYLLFLMALILGARGSLGTFPLRQDNASISVSPDVNKLLPNALISLDWARKEYQNSKQFVNVSDEDGKPLLASLLQRDVDSADLQQLLVSTPKNIAVQKHAPNVVLAVMESMGTHFLSFNNEQRDLLGSLK